MECSNCADKEWSLVTAVQPSFKMRTSAPPMLIIGSIVKNIPSRITAPSPGLPVTNGNRFSGALFITTPEKSWVPIKLFEAFWAAIVYISFVFDISIIICVFYTYYYLPLLLLLIFLFVALVNIFLIIIYCISF